MEFPALRGRYALPVRTCEGPNHFVEADELNEQFEALKQGQVALNGTLTGIADQLDEIVGQVSRQTKPLLTVAEVAVLTGRADYTVRRWIKEGKLKAHRVQGTGPKGRLLIHREDLMKRLE